MSFCPLDATEMAYENESSLIKWHIYHNQWMHFDFEITLWTKSVKEQGKFMFYDEM